MNKRSAEVIIEIVEILKANSDINMVSTGKVEPLVSETVKVATYVQHPNVIPKLERNSPEADGYDYHGFYTIICNVDCLDNEYLVYDISDSIQRSLLNDSAIWDKLIDRNIIAVEYDNAEFSPKRSVVIAIEVVFRLTCN